MQSALFDAASSHLIVELETNEVDAYLQAHDLVVAHRGPQQRIINVYPKCFEPLVQDVIDGRIPKVRLYPPETKEDLWVDQHRTATWCANAIQEYIDRGERVAVSPGAVLMSQAPGTTQTIATFFTRRVVPMLHRTRVVLPPGSYHGFFMIVEPVDGQNSHPSIASVQIAE